MVTQHWNDIKGSDRDWPERHEIDTAEIMESWQHCFVIEVKDQGYICEMQEKRLLNSMVLRKRRALIISMQLMHHFCDYIK